MFWYRSYLAWKTRLIIFNSQHVIMQLSLNQTSPTTDSLFGNWLNELYSLIRFLSHFKDIPKKFAIHPDSCRNRKHHSRINTSTYSVGPYTTRGLFMMELAGKIQQQQSTMSKKSMKLNQVKNKTNEIKQLNEKNHKLTKK